MTQIIGNYELCIQANKEIWDLVQRDESNFVPTIEALLNRILMTNFAGVYDEYSVDYIVSTNCSFETVPEAHTRYFSTPIMQKNSPYVSAFSDV